MERFHVPRHWLLMLAGAAWGAVGTMLCYRAFEWMSAIATQQSQLEELAGIALAFFLYSLVLSKAAQKNIDRINTLPGKTHVHRFIPLKSYFMIIGMITLGIALRNSSLSKEWLILPYTAMGGSLIMGSILYFRSVYDPRG